MGSELLHDQVDLAVIHFPCYLLGKEQAVKDGIKAPQGGKGFFGLYLGIVGRGSDILILAYFLGKGGKGVPADFRVFFILVVVLIERISQGVFFSGSGKRLEFHVCQFRHIINLVWGMYGPGQCCQCFFRLRVEVMGLAAQYVLQVVPVVRGHGNGFLQYGFALLHKFAVYKADAAEKFRCQTGMFFIAFLIARVIIVHGNRQIAVVPGQDVQPVEFPQVVQAGVDGSGRVEFSFVVLFHFVTQKFQFFLIRIHFFFRGVDQGQIPGEFPGNVFT